MDVIVSDPLQPSLYPKGLSKHFADRRGLLREIAFPVLNPHDLT